MTNTDPTKNTTQKTKKMTNTDLTKNTTQKTKKMANTDPTKNTTQQTKKMTNTDPTKNRGEPICSMKVMKVAIPFTTLTPTHLHVRLKP
jgi:hypothetical protein